MEIEKFLAFEMVRNWGIVP